jgi:hypothetical protein
MGGRSLQNLKKRPNFGGDIHVTLNPKPKKIANVLYLSNLTIFNKTKSVTSFKTLQNGGVHPDEIQKRSPKLCPNSMEQKNCKCFISFKLDNF